MNSKIRANMFRGIESVGGLLHFEENALVFKPHAINIQTETTTIPYCDIKNIQTRNTLLLVPNGVLITMNDGSEYKLVVWNRSEIIQFIKTKAGI